MSDLEDAPDAPQRLSPADALAMLTETPTPELMWRAHRERTARHGSAAYFTHSLNLNPTNICENRCELCAFWREESAGDAYRLDLQQARERLAAAANWQLTDLHIVGGLGGGLDLAYYESLIRMAGQLLPGVLVQALTAVEIEYLARTEGLDVPAVLRRLKAAGLGSIPGGGAEILSDPLRKRICSNKITSQQWLDVHREAHRAGLATNATMLFGHIETPGEIIEHMTRLRDLQDQTHGFAAFIPLPFHPAGTKLPVAHGPGGDRIVRVTALARIFLDNVPHIRVLANYVDRKLLQVLLCSGADDVGPTSLDERIARAAGAPPDHKLESLGEMESFLTAMGLRPMLVNSAYRPRGHGAPAQKETAIMGETPMPRAALAKAEAFERLSADEAIALHDHAELGQLGLLAHRRRMHVLGEKVVTFVIDRNISFTNVCQAGCKFCAFHVDPAGGGGFTMSIDQIVAAACEAAAAGATQVMLQGGLNPNLPLSFYEDMLSAVKRHSGLWVHSLSPAEVQFLSRQSGLSVAAVLERLRKAGLDSLPGGGAEILVSDVRRRVSPGKISAEDWLAVMETAQTMGLATTATMVFGLGETTAQRVEHLMRIRRLQDKTGRFTAFIPWSFQSARTQLSLPAQAASAYLRMVALSRLVLDNVLHIQAGWVTEGPDVAQVALSFGADDWGGVLMEEKVVRSTGLSYSVNAEQVAWLIREMGFTPRQRTTQYKVVSKQ